MGNSEIKCYSCIHRGNPVADTGDEPKMCQGCCDVADDDGYVFHRNYEPDIKEYIICGIGADEQEKLKRIGRELIRCEKCKHGETDEDIHPQYWCEMDKCLHEGDFFCAYGENE